MASLPNKQIALTRRRGVNPWDSRVRPESIEISAVLLPDATGERDALIEFDAEASLFVDLRGELANVPPNEGGAFAHSCYLTVAEGKFPRDIAIYEIKANYQEVRKAKVKAIAGLYGLGCFKRYFRQSSNNIIDARWATTWKMIEGNVRVNCSFAVRGFTDTFQDLDVYAGATSWSGQRFANAVAAGNPDFIILSLDVSQVFAQVRHLTSLVRLLGRNLGKYSLMYRNLI